MNIEQRLMDLEQKVFGAQSSPPAPERIKLGYTNASFAAAVSNLQASTGFPEETARKLVIDILDMIQFVNLGHD